MQCFACSACMLKVVGQLQAKSKLAFTHERSAAHTVNSIVYCIFNKETEFLLS